MSRITDKIAAIDRIEEDSKDLRSQTLVSFEFFPPKTEAGVDKLKQKLSLFKSQRPLFVDFTWGAGGSTSDTTLDLSKYAQKAGLEVNMHLTCTNMPSELIDSALAGAKEAGIRNILALRGDPPHGQEKWVAAEGGFSCALDLVKHIKEKYGDYFSIAISGYPEGHPEVIKPIAREEVDTLSDSEKSRIVELKDGNLLVCRDEDFAKEISYLKQKVDAGGSLIVTQLFYDAQVFINFVAACREAGISVPILPGIMPLATVGGFERMTSFCKTRVPSDLRASLKEIGEDSEKVKEFGVEYCTKLCSRLLESGVRGLHFYTLNTEVSTFAILKKLDLLLDV